MKRKYYGIELDENMKIQGKSHFVVFGEMSTGTKCYHKILNEKEDTSSWYGRYIFQGHQLFIKEGE